MALTLAEQNALVQVAVGMYDAAPGGVYLNDFTNFVEAGNSIQALVNVLAGSPSFQAPAFFPNSLTNGQFGVKFIDQLVGTDVAAADKAWAASWIEGQLNAGVSRGDAIINAVSALSAIPFTDPAWGTASQAYANKVTVAQYYSVVAGGNATDIGELQAVIADVTATSDVSTPAAIDAIIQASGSGSGDTFVLTPGIDFADTAGSIRNVVAGTGIPSDFKFTSANETVTATSATIAGGDTLVDGVTTDNDVMNLALNLPGATFVSTTTNIETFNVTASNPAAATLVGLVPGTVTGLQNLNFEGAPAGSVTVAGTTVGDTGVTNIDGSGLTSVVSDLIVDSSTAVSNAALTMTGGAGADVLSGGLGADIISGGDNGDFLAGGASIDTLNGDAGNDGLAGGQQDDALNGGAGADVLAGGVNDDTFNGGADNDILGMNVNQVSAGTAAASITAAIAAVEADAFAVGDGADTVVFGADLAANGADIVYGFTDGVTAGVGVDVLNVSAFLGAPVVTTTAAAGTIALPGDFGIGGANVAIWGAQAAIDTGADGVLSFAELAAARTAGWIDLGNSATVVIAYDDTVGGAIAAANGFAASTAGTAVHYVTTDAIGAIASVELVGIVDAVVSTNLTAANFA